MAKKVELYTQCELRRNTSTGYLKKVCWIPSHGAVKDKQITLDDDLEVWTVFHVGSELPLDLINDSHDSKKIWTATSGPCPRGNK